MRYFVLLLGILCATQPLLAQEAKQETKDRSVKTDNFIVDASSPELGKAVAVEAEKLRNSIATKWTGGVLPKWDVPCLIFVSVEEKPWAWTYHYRGTIRGIMIRGSRESILNHSLPHELTHAVIISHYGDNLPRWCDEGIAVSSEKDCPHRLNGRWGVMPLKELFAVKDYPPEWEPFYGQSFSVTAYLVERDRSAFMEFVRLGSREGWEKACQEIFHIKLEDLDNDWKQWHRNAVATNDFKMDAGRNTYSSCY